MRIKYNRTSTINQEGERFKLDKEKYDLVLFDKGVSGKVEFFKRPEASKLITLVEENKVKELVVEELSRLGRNTVDTISTLKWLDDHQVNVVVRGMGNLQSRPNNVRNPVFSIIGSVLVNLHALEREKLLEITAMGRKAYVLNGGKLGRKFGSVESREVFLNKSRSRAIQSLLQKGKSVRDISSRLKVSTKTVMKVKKYIG